MLDEFREKISYQSNTQDLRSNAPWLLASILLGSIMGPTSVLLSNCEGIRVEILSEDHPLSTNLITEYEQVKRIIPLITLGRTE